MTLINVIRIQGANINMVTRTKELSNNIAARISLHDPPGDEGASVTQDTSFESIVT